MATIGISTWIWNAPCTTESFEQVAPHIKQLGYDVVEVPIETVGDLDYARAGSLVKDLGLGVTVCAAMSPDRDLLHADASVRQTGVAYLRQCVDAAQTLGATNVVGPMYSAVGRTWQQTADERRRDLDLLVPQLTELAGYAADHGAVLCVEPLNRFETSFLNLADQAIELVDRVASPACGLLLDTFHMNIEERSIGAAIRAAGSRLQQLHACENDRGAPGSGHVPWPEVAAACAAINFTGPFVIESFTSEVKSIAKAAAIWRPLAPTQDTLATDGITFLRRLLG